MFVWPAFGTNCLNETVLAPCVCGLCLFLLDSNDIKSLQIYVNGMLLDLTH